MRRTNGVQGPTTDLIKSVPVDWKLLLIEELVRALHSIRKKKHFRSTNVNRRR